MKKVNLEITKDGNQCGCRLTQCQKYFDGFIDKFPE